MKKNLLWAASLACLCASCASDAIVEENRSSEEIRFRAFTEGSTRADKVYCPTVAPDEFNIYAYDAAEDGNLIIDGDLIKDENGSYVNKTTTRYWPQTGDLYFDAVLNGTPDASRKIAFEVATDAASQKDLIYARNKGSKSDGTVALNFRHALSQIVFNASNTNATLTVEIRKVELHNVYSKGTYELPTDLTTTTIADGGNHAGTDAGYLAATGRGTWGSSANTLASYTINLTTAKTLTGVTDATAISSANATDALMLIPGSYTAWDKSAAASTSTGSYFILDVKITQKKNASETAATIWDGEVAIPVDIEWLEGKRYVYTFAFGKGEGGVKPDEPNKPVFVPIDFTVTVDEFVPSPSEIVAGGADNSGNSSTGSEENTGGDEGGSEGND